MPLWQVVVVIMIYY